VGRVVIRVPRGEETAEFLVEAMGFVEVGREGAARRLVLAGGGGVGASAAGEDLVLIEDAGVHEPMGAGTVHHVAWRVPDSAAQARAAERLARAGVRATAVMDREYFRSIYFRVPGGVVFEIATDGPGFAVDEEASRLGDRLCLPRRYEGMRAELERSLVAL
jgi:glyoxalase family protein